jgi:hypothetical protein
MRCVGTHGHSTFFALAFRSRRTALAALPGWCGTYSARCYTYCVPTIHPRYAITDTGTVRELLDDAQREWPEVGNRKELLLRLAQAGHDALGLDRAAAEASRRRELQRAALEELPKLVDIDALLSDSAWQ